MQVHIESPYGTKVGGGPLKSARNWRSTYKLDGAGSFSFEMSLADEQIDHVIKKRYAVCEAVVGTSHRQIGKVGIIDEIEVEVTDMGPVLKVSGSDLMRELTYRTVAALQLFDMEWITPDEAKLHGRDYYGDPTNDDLPYAIDDNVGTDEHIELLDTTPYGDHYLYVGHDEVISGVRFDFGGSINNNVETLPVMYYADDLTWHSVASLSDGTEVGGAPWAQDGDVTFTRPTDAALLVHDGDEKYWIRFGPPSDPLDEVEVNEIDVLSDTETATGLAEVMAFAPAGWSLDTVNGYAATEDKVYMQFNYENVLEALRALTEMTGEHFVLGAGRKIIWLQDDPADNPTDCGWRAVGAYGDSMAIEGDPVCGIIRLKKTVDSAGQCSRIYPFGAGAGSTRITLVNATDSAAAGYTLSTAGNYIKKDTEDAALRIDFSKAWPEIGRIGESVKHDKLVSNQLLAAAYEYLKRHLAGVTAYELELLGLTKDVQPGEYILVDYWLFENGVKIVSVQANLIILEATVAITEMGLYTIGLKVATTDAFPETEASVVAGMLTTNSKLAGRTSVGTSTTGMFAHPFGGDYHTAISIAGLPGTSEELSSHESASNVHGAATEATASKLMIRDGASQAKVGEPTEDDHIGRKVDLDDISTNLTAHGYSGDHDWRYPTSAGIMSIDWRLDGALSVLTGVGGAIVLSQTLVLTKAYIYCIESGSAGSTIVDIHKNGTTIFTTQGNRPTLAYDDADGLAVSAAPDVITGEDGDIFTLDIDQIATGAEGLSVLLCFNLSMTPSYGITRTGTDLHPTVENDNVIPNGATADLGTDAVYWRDLYVSSIYLASYLFLSDEGALGTPSGPVLSFALGDHLKIGASNTPTNYLKISKDGVITLVGTAKRVLTLRPEINVDEIKKQGVPVQDTRGAFFGYTMPIYDADHQELWFRQNVPARWDGASNIEFHMLVRLAAAEDVNDDFNFQLSWNQVGPGEVTPDGFHNTTVETNVTDGTQYQTYELEFTINYDADGGDPIVAHDLLGWRIRRIAAAGTEIAGAVIVMDWHTHYVVDKMFKAP